MTYNQIHGWFNWERIYDRMADQVAPGGCIVELGVWKGKSLAYLATRIANTGKMVRVVGVDAFDGRGLDDYTRLMSESNASGDIRPLYQHARDNLDACGFQWVQLIQYDAISAANLFCDKSVNFLFIDDLHEPLHVRNEILAWMPKLIRPTWIAGDDCSQVKDGVLSCSNLFSSCEQDGGCWIAKLS
jgi:cephalosporin hydroxylase